MSATRRAPRVTVLVNAISKPLLAAGMPMGYNALLTTTGRTSGLPRTTPLAIIEVDGRRWVWSPWGEVHWVKNLRVAGEATLTIRRREHSVRAVELDPEQRVAFFRDTMGPFVQRIPFGSRFLRLLDGVDIMDPVATAQGRPVFELIPIEHTAAA